MKNYQSNIEGEFIVDAAQSADEFGQRIEAEYYIPELVNNGIYLKADNEAESVIKCDFPDSKDYLKGYCYPDTRFFGKYHYPTTSSLNPVELSGTFIEHDNCIEVFGELHAEDGMRCFSLVLYYND